MENDEYEANAAEHYAEYSRLLETLPANSPRRKGLVGSREYYAPKNVKLRLKRVREQEEWRSYRQRLEKRDHKLLSAAFAGAIFSGATMILGYLFPQSLIGEIAEFGYIAFLLSYSPYIVTGVGMLAATILFGVRGYFPKTYGFLEIWVGVATLINAALAVSLGNIPSVLQYLAGIYVIIRGLDNYAKALDPKTKTGSIFKRLFNNPR